MNLTITAKIQTSGENKDRSRHQSEEKFGFVNETH